MQTKSYSLWRQELSASLLLALPFTLMQLAQVTINTSLMVMVGRLGAAQLAGAALGLQVFLSVFLFALGLAIAVAPLVAQARGQCNLRSVRRAVRQGLWATTAIAVPGGLLLWFAEPILLALGQDPAATDAAGDFTQPMAFGLAPWLWFFVLRNYMAAMDRQKATLYVMLAALLLNLLLGYGLIYGRLGLPDYGVLGAGLAASGVGLFLTLGVLICALLDPRLKRLNILGRFWRSDWAMLGEIFRIGVPIGLTMLLETALFLALLYLQGLISTHAQAAHAVVMQLAACAYMLPIGLSQATTVRVGLGVGRCDAAAAARAAAVALGLVIACTTLVALVFLLLPTTLMGLFLDRATADAASVTAIGLGFLGAAALFQFFDGLQIVALGVLRGLKDTKMPTYIVCLGYWVLGFPAAVYFAFGLDWGGLGIWLGLSLGIALSSSLMVWRVRASLGQLSPLAAP